MAKAGRKACGAKTRDGKPCKRSPQKGRNRCAQHGGKTPLGQHKGNNHALVHGIYSSKFSEEEKAMLPGLYEQVGTLEDEIVLCKIRLRRIVDAQARFEDGEVQASLILSEMRRVQRQGKIGETDDGNPVMGSLPVEDVLVRKMPDFYDLILRYTGRIQNLTVALHSVHFEIVEQMRAKLGQAIQDVEEEKRRLQQFSVIQGGGARQA